MHRITVIENFISQEDADILISEQLSPSEINPYPEYYATRFGGTAFPYNKRVIDLLVKYGTKANELHKTLNGFKKDIYVYKSFGSVWSEGQSGGAHTDAEKDESWIEWSTVLYLNDEYSGGEIYFPNQEFVYSPKKLSAVLFPSAGREYFHGVTEVLSGKRHTALFMHTSQPQYVDRDFSSHDH